MTRAFTIAPVSTPDDLSAVRTMFEGYEASLPVALDYQDFAAELASLPGRYAEDAGALLLARGKHGAPLGCVALKQLCAERCEMKRLYLVPEARGMGLGRALAEAVIAAARRHGYQELYLDTLVGMGAAQTLYASLGFRRIEPYYAPTPPGTVFMALTL